MNKMTATACAAVALVCSGNDPAHSQGRNCSDHVFMAEFLQREHSETRQSAGLAANGALLEVYAAESGSWSIVVTAPGGASCIVASGHSFATYDDPSGKKL